jgi:hypothetical protein
MSHLSHGLILTLKLASFEARHLKAKTLTKDHLFLGLLKLADIDVSDYLGQLTKPEQAATDEEINALRKALCILDTTHSRRALRKLLRQPPDEDGPEIPTLAISAGFTDTLAKLSTDGSVFPCISLLKTLLAAPGKGMASQLKSEGSKGEILASSLLDSSSIDPDLAFAQSIVAMHSLWGRHTHGNQPDLGDCWRRLAADAAVEFDDKNGVKILYANQCLVHIPADRTQLRATIFGRALAQALAEFEANADRKPCKVPLAEF